MAEPSQLSHLIESFVDSSRSPTQQAASLDKISSLLKNDVLTMEGLVREMQMYLTTTDNIVRARGFLQNYIGSILALQDASCRLAQVLTIYQCPKLKSQPNFLPTIPLKTLIIYYNPILGECCQTKIGDQWPKISQIPNIEIDGRTVRRDDIQCKIKILVGLGRCQVTSILLSYIEAIAYPEQSDSQSTLPKGDRRPMAQDFSHSHHL